MDITDEKSASQQRGHVGRALQRQRGRQRWEVGVGGKAPTAIWCCGMWSHSLSKATGTQMPQAVSLPCDKAQRVSADVTRLQTSGKGVLGIKQVAQVSHRGPDKLKTFSSWRQKRRMQA